MRHVPQPLSLGQWGQITAIMATIGAAVFASGLWASDKAIDSKYATDEDLASMQLVVTEQMDRIETSVNANTEQQKHTSKSVDGLTMVVLDLQLTRIENELAELQRMKASMVAADWTPAQERDLREHARALQSLEIQREAAMTRMLNP